MMLSSCLILLCFHLIASLSAHPVDTAAATNNIVIDAAPSVVAYQGSSQTNTHLVLAPMGRSLGYVEPLNVNRTLPRNEKLNDSLDVLDISPVYVHK